MKARPRCSQPSTPFDFTAVESTDADASDRAHDAGQVVLDAILSVLIGSRLSAKELAARALSLGLSFRHWRLRGKSRRKLARSIGISHTALNRRVRELKAHFSPRTANTKVSTRTEGNPARSVPPRT